VLVNLTDEGRALVAQVAERFDADVAGLLDRLPPSQRKLLTTLTSRLLVAHAAEHGVDLFATVEQEA
jgi:DNA-binding MarR family transcriptional regulator